MTREAMISTVGERGSLKRKGLLLDQAGSVDAKKASGGKKLKEMCVEGQRSQVQLDRFAKEYAEDYTPGHADTSKPFVGAQPKLLVQPEIAGAAECARRTTVVIKSLTRLIKTAPHGVHVVLAQDAGNSPIAKTLLDCSTDESAVAGAPSIVSVSPDWMHTLPLLETPSRPETKGRLLIFVGTPGKYLSMCTRSVRGTFDDAYRENRLAILCRGVCMLPLGTQEQNVLGVDSDAVFSAIAQSVRDRGEVVWGHGPGSRATVMQRAFGYVIPQPMPKALVADGEGGGMGNSFEHLVRYVAFLNKVKLARPSVPVLNWYDTGLLVSVMQGAIAESGMSMLTDGDGLAMLRDASSGHIISKLNQMIAVEPYSRTKGVYNFFIGDGACRLNGGAELALHLMEGYSAKSMTTLFILNNHRWAIEDNLVGDAALQHRLYDVDFYNLLSCHAGVVICGNELELREAVSALSRRTNAYLMGAAEPVLSVVVVRGLDVNLPPVLGDCGAVVASPEMEFMRRVLGKFAEGCENKVPLYGCSAFEYIQYLHMFMEKTPEGEKYQYVCGRTDIQAAQMCGFSQPDGKCVLFINDVYGVNSLGESLRMVLSGFGGKQLLVMIWHPTVTQLMDHFHLHRQPLVWPSVGASLAKYYVRTEADALFVDFEGASTSDLAAKKVTGALASGTPLVFVNMLPEQERDYVSLDLRAKAD